MNNYFSQNFFELNKNQRNLVFLITEFAFIDKSVQKFITNFSKKIYKEDKNLVILNYFSKSSGFSDDWAKQRISVIKNLFPEIFWIELKKPLNPTTFKLWRNSWRFAQWFTLLDKLVDQNVSLISSSESNLVNLLPIIEGLLKFGNMPEVTKLLGYYFFFRGKVVHGKKQGSTIDYPTANLNLPKNQPIPQPGCFVTLVCLDGDDQIYFGLTCIINEKEQQIFETHILNFNHKCYSKNINVYFLFRYRDNYPFTNLTDLKKWIQKDLKIFDQKISFDPQKII